MRSEKELLYRIGTASEIPMLSCRLPELVKEKLLHYVSVLDAEYGTTRDYLKIGGYAVIAETSNDVAELRSIIDYDSRLCEWVSEIGNDYLSALYLLGDDYSIVVIMPVDVAPKVLLNELKGEI